MATAATLADLPVSGVKFHVLHVLKNTPLEELFREGKIELLDMNKYVNIICKFIGYLPPGCVILRLVSDAKGEFLVAPAWIQEKQKVIRAIEQRMEDLDLYQGKLLSKEDFQ